MKTTTNALEAFDISYCCTTLTTLDATKDIKQWIAAKEAEGWTVQFSVRQEPLGPVGVMWQCVSHKDGQPREFTECISMTGREFRMN